MRYFVRGDGKVLMRTFNSAKLSMWGDLFEVEEADVLLLGSLPLAHKAAAKYGGEVVEWDDKTD